MKNYYEILGLSQTATKEEIRKTYRKLSVKFHPDKNDGEAYFTEMFRQINDAHQTLTDDFQRQQYNRKLNEYLSGNDKGKVVEELRSMQEKVNKDRQDYLQKLKEQEQRLQVRPTVQSKAPRRTVSKTGNMWSKVRKWKAIQRVALVVNVLLVIYLVFMPSQKHNAAKANILGANGRVIPEGGVNIRVEPNSKAKVLYSVPNGRFIKVIDHSAPLEMLDGKQNRWYKVQYCKSNFYRLNDSLITGWAWGGMIEDL